METKDLNNKIALTAASLETLYKLKSGEITVNDLQYLNNDKSGFNSGKVMKLLTLLFSGESLSVPSRPILCTTVPS